MTAFKLRRCLKKISSFLLLLTVFCLQGCASKGKGVVRPAGPDSKEQKIEETPKLRKPVVRRVWVPPQVRENGSIYEDGYWRYLIEKEAVWSK